MAEAGFNYPDCSPITGRTHYDERRSDEWEFKPRRRQCGEGDHWHLRPSAKKVLDLQFSQALPRRERTHYQEPIFDRRDKLAGIRTFSNREWKTGREYSLEDRMQRKTRIDQFVVRRNSFKDEGVSRALKM